MKIKKILIKDFRAIVGTLGLDLTNTHGNPLDLVVLTGPNGCGKTSIIEACIFELGHSEWLGKKGDVPENIRVGMEQSNIGIWYDVNGEEKVSETIIVPVGHGEIAHVGKSGLEPNIKAETPIIYFPSWRDPDLPLGVFLYADGKGQDVQRTEKNRLFHIVNEIVNIIARRSFSEFETDRPDEASTILGKINNAWRRFYPDAGFDRFFASTYGEKKYNIFLYKADHDKRIPIDALSSGEIEIFIMFGWLAIHDISDGIIFIDEPELHLHPAWQRIILKAIQTVAPGAQIIAATHSPLVLSSVEPQCIKMIEHPDTVKANEQFERSAPSPDASYGLDANRVLNSMNVPERPPEILSKFSELFDLIDQNKLDQAKLILTDLYDKIHIHDDPDLVFADTLIRRKEIIGK